MDPEILYAKIKLYFKEPPSPDLRGKDLVGSLLRLIE